MKRTLSHFPQQSETELAARGRGLHFFHQLKVKDVCSRRVASRRLGFGDGSTVVESALGLFVIMLGPLEERLGIVEQSMHQGHLFLRHPMFRHSTVSPALMVISVGANRSLSFISTAMMFSAPVARSVCWGFCVTCGLKVNHRTNATQKIA